MNVLRKHEKKESALIENMRVCYCDEKSGNVLVLCANLDGFCQDNYLVTVYIPKRETVRSWLCAAMPRTH